MNAIQIRKTGESSSTNAHKVTRLKYSILFSLPSVLSPCLRASVVILLIVTCANWSFAQTAPSTQKSPSDFEVHDWVVLVCSPFQQKANQDGLVVATLPQFVQSRRQSASEQQQNVSQPIGLIRVFGSSTSKIDVKLGIHNGRPLAQWPKARSKAESLLWENLACSEELPSTDSIETVSRPEPIPETNWLNELRHGPAAYLHNDTGIDRFLLYDLELDYTSPLKIEGGKDFAYSLRNTSSVPLRDLSLYKPEGSGWRSAEIAEVAAANKPTSRPASAPTTTPTTAPSTQASTLPTSQPATSPVASTAPAATAPSTVAALPVQLTPSPTTQPSALLAPWKERLTTLGIDAADAESIVHILEKQAIDSKRLTAVYLLDPGEMDRLMPLEVLPEPKKTVRVGIVILKDADPSVAGEIQELIAQLGDDQWSKRDAAYTALTKLGKAAKAPLEKAVQSKDLEIAWRAERLLAAISQDPNKPPQ